MRQENRASSGRALLARPAPAFLYVLATTVLASAAILTAIRSHRDRLNVATGRALWIWRSRDVPEPKPVHFFAAREFVVERVPSFALAKIFVDRRFVLFVNGSQVGTGEKHPGDALSLFDVAGWLHPGTNRVVIEADSPNGVGGILFALDLGTDRTNVVVSDENWRVAPSEAVLHGGGTPATVWGRPPMYPWGYPRISVRSSKG